ncbi:MAG TPA: CAP domain-containing protein [Polyangia bacterium]|nr:CAP domain-containing protein [Polyangia bacterium]
MRKALAIAALSWLPLFTGIAGCERGISVERVQSSLGQPVGDYPNYDERVALYATNRARVDPTAEGWPAYPAQPPMQWQVDLNRSARAHSLDMRDTPCFQHNSCDGTDAFVRVKTFYTGPWMSLGENISAGQSVSDGFIAVHNWLYEIGATSGETGHRDNIFSAKFTLVGNGFVPGGTKFQNYWTQDFVGTNVTRPRMGDGIHFPGAPAAGAPVTFGTTYFDAGGAAPSRVAVVVDGTCSALTLARGTAARGAYEAKLSLPAGCHSYFFLASTAATTATYPDVGELQVGVAVAAAACPLAVAARAGNGCTGGSDAGAAPDGSGKGSGGGNGQGGGAGGGDEDAAGSAGAGGSDQGGAGASSSGGGQPGSGGEDGAADPDAGVPDAGVAPIPAPAGRDDFTGSTFGCAVAASGQPGDRDGAAAVLPGVLSVLAVMAGAFFRSSRRGRQPVRRRSR